MPDFKGFPGCFCIKLGRVLEPACGDGNFLSEILSRKLAVVRQRYKKSPYDYERNAILALTSIYGVDILADNAQSCRQRLFEQWDREYTDACGRDANDEARRAARFILDKNIVCGNALSMMCVDENQRDTDKYITFTEWTFPANDARIKRREYRLDVLLRENDDPHAYEAQMSLFADDIGSENNWMIDPETKEAVPRPIREYPPVNYRRLGEHE